MPDTLYNFSDMLRRIGDVSGDGLDFLDQARFTVQAGDLSHLAPVVPVPVGLVHIDEPAVALQFTGCAIQSLAPGGIFIPGGQWIGSIQSFWWIADANPFTVAGDTLLPNPVGAGLPVSTVVTTHRDTVERRPLAGGHGIIRGSAPTGVISVPHLAAPGQFILFQLQTPNSAFHFSIAIQEIPAPSRVSATVDQP